MKKSVLIAIPKKLKKTGNTRITHRDIDVYSVRKHFQIKSDCTPTY